MQASVEDIAGLEIYAEFRDDVKLWEWLGIADKNMCKDCLARHRMAPQSYEEWRKIGLPRTGATRCGWRCRCTLTPAGSVTKENTGLILEGL